MQNSRLILGVDPGLNHTGWGIIRYQNNHLSFVACGVITPKNDGIMSNRLAQLSAAFSGVIDIHHPLEAALEETFVNKNAKSSLLLAHARGVVMACLGLAQIPVQEYAPTTVKKTVVGAGRAEKTQVQHMVRVLLPNAQLAGADSADALAVAITHAHHSQIKLLIT